jgi:4-methyl-5(b-hydroxyethyl)-thiazole monophosphate biosynthesis
MLKVAVHLAEGFEEIEAVTIIDVLRRAEIESITVSVSGTYTVTGSHGITIKSDELFEEVDYELIKMIILPGGMPGIKNLNSHEGLKKQILEFYKNRKPLAAICAAPLILGQLNLLEQKKATCYPGFENHLHHANITGKNSEVDGNIITGKGAAAAMEFSLRLVEFLKGREKAETVAEKLLFAL